MSAGASLSTPDDALRAAAASARASSAALCAAASCSRWLCTVARSIRTAALSLTPSSAGLLCLSAAVSRLFSSSKCSAFSFSASTVAGLVSASAARSRSISSDWCVHSRRRSCCFSCSAS